MYCLTQQEQIKIQIIKYKQQSYWMPSCPSDMSKGTTQLGVICKRAETELNPSVYVINEEIK